MAHFAQAGVALDAIEGEAFFARRADIVTIAGSTIFGVLTPVTLAIVQKSVPFRTVIAPRFTIRVN